MADTWFKLFRQEPVKELVKKTPQHWKFEKTGDSIWFELYQNGHYAGWVKLDSNGDLEFGEPSA